jgi:hypothetical protein
LIINEDDYVAVVARDVANVVFKGLVNSKSNTIPSTSNDITTLSAIYEACLDYLTESPINPHRVSIDMLPDVATQNLWKSELKKMWVYLVRNISIFSDALSDIEPTGKDLRMELREEYILMKPIVQVALVGAIKKLMNSGMNMEAAIDKASRLDWRFECADWDRIAVDPGKRIISGTAARKFLSRVIAYRLGEDLGAKELEVLENQYRTLFDSADTSRRLPEKIA